MKKILATIALLLGTSACVNGADVPVFPTGPVFKFQTSLIWGQSGPQGFNNNFFFTPLAVNESVCIFVKNNNTTNPHIFNASIVVTSDPQNSTPSDGTWQTAAFSANINAPTSPGVSGGIGASISGVSQVSINFSNSAVQGGAPDTANVVIIQTSGNCFAGNQFIGSAPQSISATSPLQVISDGLSQSGFGFASLVNPTAGQVISHVWIPNQSKQAYFDHVVISTTVAGEFIVKLNSTSGTCTGQTSVNLKTGLSGNLIATTDNACAPAPASLGNLDDIFLAANSTQIIDLRGAIANSTGGGVDVVSPAGLTGTVSATIYWYEK